MNLDCCQYRCDYCGVWVSRLAYHDCEPSKAAAKKRMDAIMERWSGTFALLAVHELSSSGSWDANGPPVE